MKFMFAFFLKELFLAFYVFLKFLGLLSGIIYFQTKINQAGIINVSGAIFFFLTSISFNNIGSVIFVSVCNSFSVI